MDEEIMQDVKEQLVGALDYDQAAKGVLSQKMVLAYILKRTVPEFESASLDDIANIYIEGTPEVSTVPVSKDKTNAGRLPWSDRIHRRSKGHRMKTIA
ncbi:hypothetical protein [Megasphaera elsdenii]|uniref:hypothetical protein n=1 Tax=Megasphaera elsdenii TaxID=907 RepID=UPI003392DC78